MSMRTFSSVRTRPPRSRLSYPGLGEAHEALKETGITRLATKRGESTDMPGVTDDEEVQFAWSPFERLPQWTFTSVEIEMINEVLLAHPPRIIFVENFRALVDGLPERVQVTCV